MTGQNNYVNRDKTFARLVAEYDEYGKLIIAVDFDNTIYDYHDQKLDLDTVILAIKKTMQLGNHVFVFTANENYYLVSNTCQRLFGKVLPINESPLEHLFDSRKPFYSLLLDDRAGLDSALRTLNQINFYIESKNNGNYPST